MAEPSTAPQKASKTSWAIAAVVVSIAGLYWLGGPEEAMTEFPMCRSEALHDSMQTLLEKEFGLEVFKLKVARHQFPGIEVGEDLEDAYIRDTCIALVYSNKGKFGFKTVVTQDAPQEQVYIEMERTDTLIATEAIRGQ